MIISVLQLSWSPIIKAASDYDNWVAQIRDERNSQSTIIKNKAITVEFTMGKTSNQPEAIIHYKYEMEFLNKNNETNQFFIFYDSQSEVSELKYSGRKPNEIEDGPYDFLEEGIFHSDIQVIQFPLNVEEKGSSRTIQYSKRVKDLRYLGQIYFNDRFPIYSSSLSFKIPKWLNVEVAEFNLESNSRRIFQKRRSEEKVYSYNMTQQQPWIKEIKMAGPSHVYPHILFLPKSYSLNGDKRILFEELSDLYFWYKTLIDDIPNQPDILKNKVREITLQSKTPEDKVRTIYNWVQDNIRYIAFEDGLAGYQPEACQVVFKNKYGDCKGMSNLLAEMLKIAGFDARLTWLGTRRIAYSYNQPSLFSDNHMICALIQDDEITYLDATEKYLSLGEVSSNIQNKEVLIQNGESFILSKVPERDHLSNLKATNISLQLNKNNSLIGTGNFFCTGEAKSNVLEDLRASSGDPFKKIDQLFDDQLSDFKVINLLNKNEPIRIDLDIRSEDHVSDFGTELYIALDFLATDDLIEMPIDRTFNYQFDYRRVEVNTIVFEVPIDYIIAYIPESLIIENEDFIFSIQYKKRGNKIFYERKIQYPSFELKTNNFSAWNIAISKFHNKIKERVVVERVN